MSTALDRRIILGTAGHIDHGKTSLIQCLTGVNTDRLPEERRRGITIVLGFAPLRLANGTRIGVVDVPGHERFVKNMVAGAGGIDMVLLVVAADEGMMPQTREHLEICQLLGIEHGVIALTKTDRAPDLVELALDDVKTEVEGTFLQSAPIVPCSAVTREGIDELQDALSTVAERVSPRRTDRPLLLPIDRIFTVKGFGTVVTGTLIQGQIRVGDTVDLLPPEMGRDLDKGVKVRGLQVFQSAVEAAYPGQRVAVNLQGIERDAVHVGQSLFQRDAARPTRRLSIQVSHLAHRDKPLKTGAKVILHTGTALMEAGLTLLDADTLDPGESGFATARLKEPVAVVPGQRFILRGFEAAARAGRTLGGGVVLDPEPGRRRRKQDGPLQVLAKLHTHITKGPDEGRLEAALIALIDEAGPAGLGWPPLARRLGHTEKMCMKKARAGTARTALAALSDRAVSLRAIEGLQTRVLAEIEAHHAEFPFRAGPTLAELSPRFGPKISSEVVQYAANRLVSEKRLAKTDSAFHLPKHRPRAEADPQTKSRLLDQLQNAGLTPPLLTELEASLDLPSHTFRELLAALVRSRELVPAGPKLYFATSAFDDAVARVLKIIEEEGELTAQRAKTELGLSRKYLIPLLETMDKRNITVRVGESRKAR